MRVKVPAVVKLGAHEYQVRFVSGMVEKHGNAGMSKGRRGCIEIDPAQTDTQRLQTLFHELGHQGHYVFGAGCPPPKEAQLDSWAEAAAQVLTGAMGLEFDWAEVPEVEAV